MKTALIVDDYPLIRMAVSILLEREGFQNIIEVDNGVDAIQQVREQLPDLVILDISIPKFDGLEVIMRLSALSLRLKIVVLSSQPASLYSTRCMQAGAAGYVCKTGDLGELVNAIRAVMSGYHYFPNLAFNSVRRSDAQASELDLLNRLSDREMSVLRQLALGKSNKEVGVDMALSNKTISTYKIRVMNKLNIGTLVELADIAKRNALA
ncbi:response regulator transcription factor [Pseudomonas sp. MH9.2]|uniref:response regulator transcription factor n=1 Tax=unclassified Pseudomonas TaxID=196821 RepID=UPI002AC89F85|nr:MULTISPECIES: response regulator transcription factor [unclassified Pseudomonas]MEB0029060.1 response regulator transcription factor [Pseudomonas sp. MH9.2]MEB0150571.1 response regulator transcription factor [Pseudomonas sp. CCC2.2]MEE3509592.1 response regulator transcription factor [Pseudomonas sp. 10C3]WPX68880.1 response regulator transcription factor [Pseudomonas sp. MH9.2]